MSRTAHAAVATAPWTVAFLPVAIPAPGPHDVVVRLTRSWISNGTEGSFVRGERIAGDTPRSDTDPLPFPHVPGYQKVGVVTEVGDAVTDLVPGQRVFATVSSVEGMFYGHGGHVSPAVTHRSQIFPLPDSVTDDAAAGLVLTQVGFNCGIRPPVSPGDLAVVLGDGMVGHWAAQTLAARGADVLMAGRHDYRLERFTRGRTLRIGSDPVADIRAACDRPIAVLCDTVGSIATVDGLLDAMGHDSHIVSAGFYGHDGKIDIQRLRNREITLHCPAGWSADRLRQTLAWIEDGRLETAPLLVTHRFPAERAGDAFDLVLNRSEPVLGVLLDWENVA